MKKTKNIFSGKMYSLVQFENGELYVAGKNKITVVKGADCLVKYKNGAKYKASIIKSDGKNTLL